MHQMLTVLLVERLQPVGVCAEHIQQHCQMVIIARVRRDRPAGAGREHVTLGRDPVFAMR